MTYDREKLIEEMARAMQATSGGQPFTWENAARAALAIAEPVIAERMRDVAIAASETIEFWGAYASEYFQEKHDLAGDIELFRELSIPLTGEGEPAE